MHHVQETGQHQRIRAAAAQELTSATIRVRLHTSNPIGEGEGTRDRVAGPVRGASEPGAAVRAENGLTPGVAGDVRPAQSDPRGSAPVRPGRDPRTGGRRTTMLLHCTT